MKPAFITLPVRWTGKRIFIVFDGAMTDTEVRLNNRSAGPIRQHQFFLPPSNFLTFLTMVLMREKIDHERTPFKSLSGLSVHQASES